MKTRTPSEQRRSRAITGLVLGIVIAALGAVMAYVELQRGKASLWLLLVIAAMPLLAWGSANLAQYRGYPGAAGYGLFILAFFVSGFIGLTRSPLTVGFAFLFMGLMPPVVLLALPRKSGHLRRW